MSDEVVEENSMNVLGIDVGGTGIKGAPVDTETGEMLADRYRIPTPVPSKPKAVAKVIRKVARKFDWNGPIGCGFPAPIRKGVTLMAANVDDKWVDYPAEVMLSDYIGCPVTLINDADAAGLAEMRFGAGIGQDGVVIVITIGTGLGTAIFVDGCLVPNTEFGHMELKGADAEWYASDAARKRENLSWKQWGKRFDDFLWALDKLFWPDLYILGGGASKKLNKFLEYLTLSTEIIPANMLNNAGIVGAAMAAREKKA
jgi:polyphosphate glucokinase